MSEIFPLVAGTGKQLETKESEARLVEGLTPSIRPTETGKKWEKKPKQAEAESDMGIPPCPKTWIVLSICITDLIKDIVSHYKH